MIQDESIPGNEAAEGKEMTDGGTAQQRQQRPGEEEAENDDEPLDWRICRFLTEMGGVAAIPPSSFYAAENREAAKYFARFAFCKPDEVLLEAGEVLQKRIGKYVTKNDE